MAFKNRKKNYPLYKTTEFSDFREMTENVAARYPDRVALGYKKHPMDKETLTYTYKEGAEFIRGIGTELLAMGVSGERVAIIGEASPNWVFSYFALMSVGAITVPVDKDLPETEIASILNTAGCSFAVFSKSTTNSRNVFFP